MATKSNNPFIQGSMNAPMPGADAFSNAFMGVDSFEVDLTNVESNSYTVPDGNYKVKCIEVEQSVSKGGNPMFVWTFEINEGDYTGRRFKSFTAITPAAMWKVAETVIALGVGQTGSVVRFKRTDVVGKECGALIEKTEYNGQERSQISRVMTLKELAESRA